MWNFELIDVLSYKSKQLKNQVLYTIRQSWIYYDNIKNNKPIYPQQLTLIEELIVVLNNIIMINLKNIDNWNTKALKELEINHLKTNSVRVARLEQF